MKKIFVTGSGGFVGSRFVELFKDKYELLTPEVDELDLTNKRAVESFITKVKPDVIVHFAAFTDVSAAEEQRGDEKGSCWKVNVEATRNLTEAMDPNKTHFIHISTDMVFSGSEADPGPYEEDHEPENNADMLTWYGYTKKRAEDVVKKVLGDKYSILRLIYPVRFGYDKKLDPQVLGRLKMYDEGKFHPLFSDQKLSITDVDDVCKVLEKLVESNKFGIFHASSADLTTPFELGSYLIKKARGKEGVVEASTFEEFVKKSGKPVRWPKFGGLRVEKSEKLLNMHYSNWKDVVDKLVRQGV